MADYPEAPRSGAILSRLEHFGIKLGLERIARLLESLGEPQRATPTVLVAGTNGKGSTSALIASIAAAAGLRVGTFASPHLESLRERVGLGGRAISDDELAGHLERIVEVAARESAELPTFFEAMTLSALLHYREHAADLAVMEVGLGGRLDATNVSDPLVSVVTSIGYDHQKQLGDTLTAIGGEKGAIGRPGRPLVAWARPDEVARSLEAKAREIGARLVAVDELTRVTVDDALEPGAQRLRLTTPRDAYELSLSLPGEHQRRNAAVAVVAAEELRDAGFPSIDREAIEQGVASCRWPGRLEWVELPDDRRRVLLDVAHNPAGIETVARYLRERGEPVHLLFGAVGDKSIEKMLPQLVPLARRVTLTRPETHRAGDPHEWLPLVADATQDRSIEVVVDPGAALTRALDTLEPSTPLVVTGSIYLVGAIRRRLRERYGVPPVTT